MTINTPYTITLISLLCLASCLLISCGKDSTEVPPLVENPIDSVPIYYPGEMLYGSACGKKAQQTWKASGIAFPHDDNAPFWSIRFDTYNIDGFRRETISLSYLPATGEYPILHKLDEAPISGAYYTVDDDILEDVYNVDETAKINKITITTLDTIENQINGVFTVAMKIAAPEAKRNPNNPDHVVFSDVNFSVQIFD